MLFFSGIVSRAMFAPESLLISDSEWWEKAMNDTAASSVRHLRLAFLSLCLWRCVRWFAVRVKGSLGGLWNDYISQDPGGVSRQRVTNIYGYNKWLVLCGNMPKREIACSKSLLINSADISIADLSSFKFLLGWNCWKLSISLQRESFELWFIRLLKF